MEPRSSGDSLNPRTFAILVALAAIIAMVPLFAAPILPFFDYPNHLARIAILRDLISGEYSGELGKYYALNAAFLPNLGMDALMVGLASVLPIELAGQIAVALVAALYVTGFARLHAAIHGRRTVWALAGGLTLYTLPLLFGFLNFVLAIALLLHFLAICHRQEPGPRRELFAFVAGFVLLLSHLLGLGLVLLLGPIFDRWRGLSWRQAVKGNLAFLPALAATLIFSPKPAGKDSLGAALREGILERVPTVLAVGLASIVLLALAFAYRRTLATKPWAVPLGLALAGALSLPFFTRQRLGSKAYGLITTTVSGHLRADVAFTVLTFAAFAALLLTRRAGARYVRLLPAAILFTLWLILPFGVSGTANLDLRFPALAALFGLLAVGPGRVGLGRGAAVVIGALLLFRSGTLARAYRAESGVLVGMRAAFARLPKDAVVIPVRHRDAWSFDPVAWRPPLMTAPLVGTLDGRFVGGAFAEPSQQPIVVRPEWWAIKEYRQTYDVPGELARTRRQTAHLRGRTGPIWIYLLTPGRGWRPQPRWSLFPLDP